MEIGTVAIISGGTASNAYCKELQSITEDLSFILPVSDDGGSTAEILRVVGGPAIGDIRSRLVRLADGSTPESAAVLHLLQHRLPAHDGLECRGEWLQIVDGSHELWKGISEPYKEIIRSFLVHFNTQILVQAKKGFNFANGSIGNFFFTGSRLFFGSLEAAIFLFTGIARIPQKIQVIPVINTTFDRCNIGAVLQNGEIVIGQSEISHPSEKGSNVVSKSETVDLDSPIERVYYVNQEGKETRPKVNPRVLTALESQQAIIYSIGSLYTSIIPCLILAGFFQ